MLRGISQTLFALIFILVQIAPKEAKAEVRQKPLTLAQAESNLRVKYPEAKIKVVTPEELQKISKCGPNNVLPVETQIAVQDSSVSPVIVPQKLDAPRVEEPNFATDNSFWFGRGYGGFDNDDFLVVVAVIGVVVVAALFVYSVGYLIEASQSGMDCKAYDEIGLRVSYFSASRPGQSRSGTLIGGYYTWAYDLSLGNQSMLMGLTAEAGAHHLELDLHDFGDKQSYDGAYFLLGPSFEFPFTDRGDAFRIELLAGTSTHSDIGLMSTLRFGFELGITEHLRLGANLGVAMVDIRGLGGYFTEQDQLSYLYGLNLGYRF